MVVEHLCVCLCVSDAASGRTHPGPFSQHHVSPDSDSDSADGAGESLIPARFLSIMSHLTLTLTLLMARVSLTVPDSDSSVSCLT